MNPPAPYETKNNQEEEFLKNHKNGPEETWNLIWKRLETRLSPAVIRLWDGGTYPLEWQGNTLVIGAYNAHCIDWLESPRPIIEAERARVQYVHLVAKCLFVYHIYYRIVHI